MVEVATTLVTAKRFASGGQDAMRARDSEVETFRDAPGALAEVRFSGRGADGRVGLREALDLASSTPIGATISVVIGLRRCAADRVPAIDPRLRLVFAMPF